MSTTTQTVTVRDLSLTVDARIFNDFDFFEEIVALNDGNIASMPKIFKIVLGKEQLSMVKNALKNEDGITTTSDMADFLAELMQSIKPIKADEK